MQGTSMNVKSRRLSLEGPVSLDLLLGGRRGGNKSSGRKAREGQSVDAPAPPLHRGLSSDMALRKESAAKETLNNPDELVSKNSAMKHSKMFHQLFQEIPEGENLTHTFSCALQKEVLYHGKLFVSDNHVCFHSSVLLKETKVVIPASSVRKVKKPNLALSTLSIHADDGEKYSFVSLRSRQMCYKLLQSICTNAQGKPSSSPRLSSAENDADDTASSYSSLEECGCDQSVEDSLDQDDVPLVSSEGARGSSSDHPNSFAKKDRVSSWVWRIVERIWSFFPFREIRNLSFLFYFYMTLMLLLLLASGYVGLRISELEEQLRSLGDLTEVPLPHTEYQEA